MTWKTELGDQIKRAREAAGLSQQSLGKAVRLSRLTIIKYESGKRGPTAEHFAKLAAALKCPFTISGHTLQVRSVKKGPLATKLPRKEQFCLPFGVARSYPGAVLRIHPTKARLSIEASVRRVGI